MAGWSRAPHTGHRRERNAGIQSGTLTFGLIDNNTFSQKVQTGARGAIQINTGNESPADAAWNTAYVFGTSEAVFIEDNTFDYDAKYDSVYEWGNTVQGADTDF